MCMPQTTPERNQMNHTKKQITEHGMSMYRQRGCRCNTCKQAAAAQRAQFRPRTTNKKIKLDAEPLLQRLTADDRLAWVNTGQRDKWRKAGIDIYNADEWCVRLGYHPIEIWGQDFYQQCSDEELINA